MSPSEATAEGDPAPFGRVFSSVACWHEMTGNPRHPGASAQQIIMKIIAEGAPPSDTASRKSLWCHQNVAAAVRIAGETPRRTSGSRVRRRSGRALRGIQRTRTSRLAQGAATASGSSPVIGRLFAAVWCFPRRHICVTALWGWSAAFRRPPEAFAVRFPQNQVRGSAQQFSVRAGDLTGRRALVCSSACAALR
jgi:hypothetical protein